MAINGANNVSITLQFTLTSGATTIILPTGKWGLFTWATTPLRWVIEEFDDSKNVVKREIVSITWISGDQLTIARAVEPCPIGDSASAQQQVSQVFNTPAKTKISVVMTKGMIDDINTSISTKLNISDYQNGTKVYWATSTGTDAYAITLSPAPASYQTGMTFKFMADVANTGVATLNVNGLGAKTIKKLHDQDLADGDIEINQIVTVTYDGTNFQMDSQIANIPSIDIAAQTEKTTFSLLDYFNIYDSVALGNKKFKLSNFFSVYGDGSDGDVTISTNTTLARDMYYNNLTINSTIVLNPNGYRIYVAWTLTNNGIIRRNGNDGAAGAYGPAPVGWAGGAALNQWSLNAEVWGASGGSHNSKPGGNGTSANPSYMTANGANGATSTNVYSQWAGWTGGTSTRWSLYNVAYSAYQMILQLMQLWSAPKYEWQYKTSAWAAWWWADFNVTTWCSGWGGWWNAWMVWIAARIFNNASWTVELKWWKGWDGGTDGSTGRWGGGGGWNGGTFFLIYSTLTSIGTVTLTWWAIGTGWTGAQAGSSWVTIQVQITQ